MLVLTPVNTAFYKEIKKFCVLNINMKERQYMDYKLAIIKNKNKDQRMKNQTNQIRRKEREKS